MAALRYFIFILSFAGLAYGLYLIIDSVLKYRALVAKERFRQWQREEERRSNKEIAKIKKNVR